MSEQLHLFVKNKPLLNRSVAQADRPRLSQQALKIYQELKQGPVSTSQLAAIGFQYNARLREIRDYLRADGLTVDMIERGPGGNNLYAIRPFVGSRYAAELAAKQQKTKGVIA